MAKQSYFVIFNSPKIHYIAIYDKNETSSVDRKYLEHLIKKYK
jgi:hypothetical protein